MTFANNFVGQYLSTDSKAIYRITTETGSNITGSYAMNRSGLNIHTTLNINNYVHYTSPIRRFTDQYIHLRLYREMFRTDLYELELTEDNIYRLNRSSKDMKRLSNIYKKLSLIRVEHNIYSAVLIDVEYNNVEKQLYMKWLINSEIKIMDQINNPYLEIDADGSYVLYNRITKDGSDKHIILSKDREYKMDIQFIVIGQKYPKVVINYFN